MMHGPQRPTRYSPLWFNYYYIKSGPTPPFKNPPIDHRPRLSIEVKHVGPRNFFRKGTWAALNQVLGRAGLNAFEKVQRLRRFSIQLPSDRRTPHAPSFNRHDLSFSRVVRTGQLASLARVLTP